MAARDRTLDPWPQTSVAAEFGLPALDGLLPRAWRSDAALLQQAHAGTRAASDELVRRLLPQAHAVAWRLTGNRADAEDVVQEAFCRLWQHAPRFEPRASVSTWFLTIVRNLCMDRFRREVERADPSVLDDLVDPAATPEQHWLAGVRSARLHASAASRKSDCAQCADDVGVGRMRHRSHCTRAGAGRKCSPSTVVPGPDPAQDPAVRRGRT